MDSIAYIVSDFTRAYNDFGIFSRIKDRLKIHFEGRNYVKELDINIYKIYLPPNINESAYMSNIKSIEKHAGYQDVFVAPKTYRFLDYNIYNDFEKNLLGFSVVNSSKLMLRSMHKSIRESCIIVYDASHAVSEKIIEHLAKEARYVVLVSENKNKLKMIKEYVSANFGISVITTAELGYALKSADMVITTEEIEINRGTPVWYLNNLYRPLNKNNLAINDISFKVPWDIYHQEMPLELVSAVLSQMEEKDVEKSLFCNDVFINNVTFEVNAHKQYN